MWSAIDSSMRKSARSRDNAALSPEGADAGVTAPSGGAGSVGLRLERGGCTTLRMGERVPKERRVGRGPVTDATLSARASYPLAHALPHSRRRRPPTRAMAGDRGPPNGEGRHMAAERKKGSTGKGSGRASGRGGGGRSSPGRGAQSRSEGSGRAGAGRSGNKSGAGRSASGGASSRGSAGAGSEAAEGIHGSSSRRGESSRTSATGARSPSRQTSSSSSRTTNDRSGSEPMRGSEEQHVSGYGGAGGTPKTGSQEREQPLGGSRKRGSRGQGGRPADEEAGE